MAHTIFKGKPIYKCKFSFIHSYIVCVCGRASVCVVYVFFRYINKEEKRRQKGYIKKIHRNTVMCSAFTHT